MDEAARMARAKDMGFYTGMPLYHGTGKTFDEFKAFPTSQDRWGTPGVSLARNPEMANEFALLRGNARANPQVHKLLHRAGNPVQMSLKGVEDHAAVVATLRDAFDRGHDAVMLRNYKSPGGQVGDIIVVRDANQLRSPNAAFDPARRDDAKLLYGPGATISGAVSAARSDLSSYGKDDL